MNHSKGRYQQNLRADAARVLYQILEQGLSARECLPAAQLQHNEKDKAWLQEMTYGVLRQLPILQHWLRLLLDKPLKKDVKVVEHLIMLGFYQLAYSRVSTHAAVSECVNACAPLNAIATKGLVNAVLRNFIRQDMAQNLPDSEQILSGQPKWLYKKLVSAYPNNYPDILDAMQHKAPIWLRVNVKHKSVAEYCQLLDQQDIAYECEEQQSQGIILSKGCDITLLPGYNEGWFAVQDGAAQLAAPFLNCQPGDRVLDCCAAPGGKTCHILELEPDITQCVAIDIASSRLQRIEENLARLGHKATLICGDASEPNTWWDDQQFDRILLDAPCSATGIIRRHPDIKWLRKSSDIEVLVALQAKIIDAMWPLLKSGGTMLYATCSILPTENQLQITEFLNRTPDASVDVSFDNDAPDKPGRQILPGNKHMDGFYYARLIKS
ncbi:16S rRNA (cytosine(967)-C(5))-methyltransferase RsmB [Paraglaciecola sp. L1A13]|uniref:16S rRNA (cytosine(967)-C(5))-methyltransferase RsmB n=1 Tax=Paraglaciecola sp. L1A13 TaxID=2686359 RepID=UPI00131E65CC|nr:16S rRNA (cytosine(967)-C(5))-methyltransferase RsmB [Paraglaciecola sp. L1A13]